VTLHGGALDGVTAELEVDPRTTPHLWALTPELVVTVSGDLTRDELLAVAQSLR
jgi:acetyl esterase/lipase